MGALGVIGTDSYVQVVGDHVVPLNPRHIKKAIGKAKRFESQSKQRFWQPPPEPAASPAPSAPPAIVIKKRRVFAVS